MSHPFIRSIHVQDTAGVQCVQCGEIATLNTRMPTAKTDGQRPIDHRCPSCGGEVEVLTVNGVDVEAA